MKNLLLVLALLGVTLITTAQQREKGDFQIGVQGGASLPVSTYKSLGETKIGFYSGLFLDKYFTGNKFGLGIDARYIQNAINRQDTFRFENGFISTNYLNKTRFEDYLFTFGPTYKYSAGRFQAEAYVRGGLMMQYFPEYIQAVTYEQRNNAGGNTVTQTLDIMRTANDASNRANSWAGVGGLRFSYKLNNQFALFGHVDYVQTFGREFGDKASQFTIERMVETSPIQTDTYVENIWEYYSDVPAVSRTPHKTIQAGLGIKYMFGKSKTPATQKNRPLSYDEEVKRTP